MEPLRTPPPDVQLATGVPEEVPKKYRKEKKHNLVARRARGYVSNPAKLPRTPPPDAKLLPQVVPEKVGKQRKVTTRVIDASTELPDRQSIRDGRRRHAGLSASCS